VLSRIAGLGGWDPAIVAVLDVRARAQLAVASLGVLASSMFAGLGAGLGAAHAFGASWVGVVVGAGAGLLCLSAHRFVMAAGGASPADDADAVARRRRSPWGPLYLVMFTALLAAPLALGAEGLAGFFAWLRLALLSGVVVALAVPRHWPADAHLAYEHLRWALRRRIILANHAHAQSRVEALLSERYGVAPSELAAPYEDAPFDRRPRVSTLAPRGEIQRGRSLADALRAGARRGGRV
jgi:hypothetical protein